MSVIKSVSLTEEQSEFVEDRVDSLTEFVQKQIEDRRAKTIEVDSKEDLKNQIRDKEREIKETEARIAKKKQDIHTSKKLIKELREQKEELKERLENWEEEKLDIQLSPVERKTVEQLQSSIEKDGWGLDNSDHFELAYEIPEAESNLEFVREKLGSDADGIDEEDIKKFVLEENIEVREKFR